MYGEDSFVSEHIADVFAKFDMGVLEVTLIKQYNTLVPFGYNVDIILKLRDARL